MTKRPNILCIMPDQMRGDCLSLAGHPAVETPIIDHIGEGGSHFTRAYSTCPSCIPARRTLLTGRSPMTSGVVGNGGGKPIQDITLPQTLKDAGYFTAFAGRCMHQVQKEEDLGFSRSILGSTYVGNDQYAEELDEAAPSLGGIKGIGLSVNGRSTKPWPVDEALHPTAWTVSKALELMTEKDVDQPMFLFTSFYSPHPPLFPPNRYIEHYLSKELPDASIGTWETPPKEESYADNVDAHRLVLKGEELRETQAAYFGSISHIDDQIAPLIGEFKALSKAEGRPWLILFFSDHGELLGDHYLFRKCQPYEGAANIPFLIQGSADFDFVQGQKPSGLVCLEDVMPTVLELAKVPVPAELDGRSLVKVLRGESAAVRDALHVEHAPQFDNEQAFQMLTEGCYKYIWRPFTGDEQLFDLSEDPAELNDLGDDDERVKPWRNRLIELLKDRPECFSDGERLLTVSAYKKAFNWGEDYLQE